MSGFLKSTQRLNLDVIRAQKDLAFDNEVSIPTISRDIQFLRERFNADIAYDATNRGYYYIKDFDMPLSLISSKDMLFLSLAKLLLSQYEGSPIYTEISSSESRTSLIELPCHRSRKPL